ncbi:RNA polymerase sigma factor [Sunxiuqinia sp. A32]|uniref:RNA polymerase sigma factor n=1 Tax=Sunxiuqinia sp. A32 TaxID=3461496 RepID=UPI0040460218
MLNDRYIWEDFKNEKDYALSHIYHQNIDFLFFYGRKFTDDEDIILDTIHDLFYYLIQSRRKLGETDNIRFYLITAFKRRLIKEIQNHNKQVSIGDSYHNEPEFSFSIEEDMIHSEDYSKQAYLINQGMNELNARQREILYYKFNCDLEYDQICDIMSISYDTARQLVSRAIRLMRKYLSENDFYLFFIFSRLTTFFK